MTLRYENSASKVHNDVNLGIKPDKIVEIVALGVPYEEITHDLVW